MISYAQNFEDVMLWRALGHVQNGFYIDLGAQDPIIDSVSRAFYENGWRGIHVEPTQYYANLLRENRPDETVLQTAIGVEPGVMKFFEIPGTGISTGDPVIAKQHQERGFPIVETTVSCITLASVFKSCAGKEIHWLKIDVEGMEKQVLESWRPAKSRPWIVVIESTLPLTKTESHRIWEPMLIKYGYASAYFDGLNRYYVSDARPELKDAFYSGPNVFDGFVFNGTGSVAFWSLVEERYKAKLADKSAELSAVYTKKEEEVATTGKLVEQLKQEFLAKSDEFDARIRELDAEWRNSLRENNALKDELRTSMEETIRLSQFLAAREQEFGQSLAERLKQVSALKGELQAELMHSEHQLRELSELRAEFSRITQAFALVSAQLSVEKESSATLRETAIGHRSDLEQLHASWSWRITSPLRRVSNFFPSKNLATSALRAKAASTNLLSPTESISAGHAMPTIEQDTSSRSSAVTNLTELTARHDKEFLSCAYRTLLKREPDPQGFAFFLSRLRRGDSKVQILADIRWSAEGKGCGVRLSGLETAVSRRRLSAMPFVGWLFGLFFAKRHDSETERAIRRLENQLYLLDEQFHERFDQIEMTLTRLSAVPQPLSVQKAMSSSDTSVETDPHVLEVLSALQSALTPAKKASDENRN